MTDPMDQFSSVCVAVSTVSELQPQLWTRLPLQRHQLQDINENHTAFELPHLHLIKIGMTLSLHKDFCYLFLRKLHESIGY